MTAKKVLFESLCGSLVCIQALEFGVRDFMA